MEDAEGVRLVGATSPPCGISTKEEAVEEF
jgi:hypothetical protein